MNAERITVGIADGVGVPTTVQWLVHRARTGPADVALVHAIEWFEAEPYWVATRERLEQLGSLISGGRRDVTISVTLRIGSPRHVLLEASKDADLLVIGAHRARVLRSALAGSVPEAVATTAAVPTVVVTDDAVIRDGEIVVGVAADEPEATVVFGAQEAARTGQTLRVVAGWRLPLPMGSHPVTLAEDPGLFRQSAESDVVAAASTISDTAPGIVFRTVIAEGLSAAVLSEAAEHAALIVIGRKHRTTVGGALFGSTARDLFHRTRVPVFVVPPSREGPPRP